MPKNKTHKGLLKRVKVTKNGRIKLHRAFGRHLRSHKPGSTIRKYRLPAFASSADAKRLRTLLGLKVTRTAQADAGPDAGPEAGPATSPEAGAKAPTKGSKPGRKKPQEQ